VENAYTTFDFPYVIGDDDQHKQGTVTVNSANITVTHSNSRNSWDAETVEGYYKVRLDTPGTFNVSGFGAVTIVWEGISDGSNLSNVGIQVVLFDQTGTTPMAAGGVTNQYILELTGGSSPSSGLIGSPKPGGHIAANFSGTVYAVELIINEITFSDGNFPESRWQPWVIKSIQFH
jgi:hypothetical protein